MEAMSKWTLAAAALVLSLGAGRVAAEGLLAVGDRAPKLQVKEFIKGEEVKKFDKGKVYVVEFWATWCPPCRESIPHLTELQKKYKDVTFIGVSAFENDQKKVKPFVEEMGAKMDYRVALDDVPEGGQRQDGKMAKNWMIAAKQGGIPTAFVIDGEGRIAWVGHPMELEDPLKQIVAGKWDLNAATKAFKTSVERK
jgi:thiol-disulfide isomerase/thioredoxin